MAVNKVIYGDRTLVDLTEDTVTSEKLLQGETAHNAAGEQIVGTASGGGIFYGTCTGEEANQIKAVTVSNEQNFKLKAGSILSVKFDANNTYSATTENPVKLNVNNTGAKQIYGGNTATPTGTNTTYFGRLNYYNYYVYDGIYWVWAGSSADNNTTYTPQKLGIGYGTCSTAAATVEKAVTLSGYELVTNGTIAVKFTNAVPASATLKVNSKTAKAIYYRGSAITANKIKAGDTAIFYYNGSQYHLICVDRPLDATDVTYSSGVTVKAKIDTKAEKTDIAIVESGTTASRAYSAGELVYVSGTLYRVKTAIASGATFTVGTNVEVTNVSNNVIEQIRTINAHMPIFGTTKGRGAIVDALHVDLNNVDGSANQVGYVYAGYSTNIPPDLSHGTREVFYYNANAVYVKITGVDNKGMYSEWGNLFNGITWSGWKKICGGSVTLLVVNPITSADNNYTVTGGDIKEFSKLNLQILAGASKSASSILIDTDGLMEGKAYRVTFTDGTNDVYAELVKVSDTVMKIQANPRLIELQWGIALVGIA